MTILRQTQLQGNANWSLPFLYLIWAGLVLGVSFIATPVKFQAPNLTMPVALEVGKATFHLLNVIEWAILFLIIISAYVSSISLNKWIVVALLFSLVGLQTFWLLPQLDIRTDLLITGGQASPGHYHWIYIIVEILKLALLLVMACFYLRKY